MSELKILARRLSGNMEVTFRNIKSFRLVSSLDSPADSLSAVIAENDLNGDFDAVKAYSGSRLLFGGKTDCQQKSVSGAGALLRLDARSFGAYLLDNQALPSVFVNVQIGVLFNKCIAPYGFTLYNPYRASYIPSFTIRAGMSEWDAFLGFAKRAYDTTPYVKGAQVMLRPPATGRPVTISNSLNGVRYISITHTKTPYNVISRVNLRDREGSYMFSVKNMAADFIKTTRKRYAIPSSEYADRLELDANQRIRSSMLEYEQLAVTLPGFFDVDPGGEIMIRDDKIQTGVLMIREREYFADENGFFTRLKAINPLYYN